MVYISARALTNYTIIAGSYTSTISTFLFDAAAGTLSLGATSDAGTNPSWIQLSPDSKALFATQENTDGAIISFSVQPDGSVKQVSKASSGGADPANLLVLSSGKEVVIADYSSGGVLAFPIEADGVTLGDPSPTLQLEGSGPVPGRQDVPHPHQVIEHGDELLVPDLGSDKVWRLTKAASGGYEIAGSVDQGPGSGPRHAVPLDGNLYVLHELDNSLSQYTLPPLKAPAGCKVTPSLVANFTILPDEQPAGAVWGAGELLLSPVSASFPDQYLYASNRNVGTEIDPRGDSLAIFAIKPELKLVKQFFLGLNQPRGVQIFGEEGQYIIAGGLGSGGVKVFERVDGGADLKEVASYTGTGSEKIVSFDWVD
ncbi:putative isomerase YbhE [Exidia glandulosa HHB12029]|uniref:Putative isomerase YbhE n=1 Tax=Exidia glandulosa HHB12029 TaxID=1314781 RepID=A0A165KKV1_EXIGL|nr:putative isomerase YbhE [Exidia glandulosa HHB12029]